MIPGPSDWLQGEEMASPWEQSSSKLQVHYFLSPSSSGPVFALSSSSFLPLTPSSESHLLKKTPRLCTPKSEEDVQPSNWLDPLFFLWWSKQQWCTAFGCQILKWKRISVIGFNFSLSVSDKNKTYFFVNSIYIVNSWIIQNSELKLIKQGKNTENKTVFPL